MHGKSQDFLWTSLLESSSHYPEDLMVADSPIDFLFTGYSHWPENLMGTPRTFLMIVSWRPLYSPEDTSRIPRISHGVSFYRGL